DLAALFAPDDDEAIQVMEFITSEGFGAEWAQAGGWLSPHQTFDSSQYADETTRSVAEIASSAEVFRFDGSDLMPAPVGGGSVRTAMVERVNGDRPPREAGGDVEPSWPEWPGPPPGGPRPPRRRAPPQGGGPPQRWGPPRPGAAHRRSRSSWWAGPSAWWS